MLTSSLITLINKEVPDWSRMQILAFINEIQNVVFSQNATSQMRIYDPNTGTDPLLHAVGGQLIYNISSASGFPQTAWRVYDVYRQTIMEPEANIFCLDATPKTKCASVMFKSPQSGDFFVRCYRFPDQIITEANQLEIPDAFHLSHLFEGVMGQIEQWRSGKSERYMNFYAKLLPDLVRRMSEGNRRNSFTEYRWGGV